MDATELISSLEKHEAMIAMIDQVIKASYRFKLKGKIKRGLVHELVASQIGLKLHCDVRRIINERMIFHGYRKKILHGYLYIADVERVY